MHPTRGSAGAAGAELAQGLRLALSDLWVTLEQRVLGSDSAHGHLRFAADVAWTTPQHLATAEHALVAYTRRIHLVLDTSGEDVPFLAEPRFLGAPPVSGNADTTTALLLRVSQAVEQLARLLETLHPNDLVRRWRSERGVSALAELAERAVASVMTQLDVTARATRRAAGMSPECRRRRQGVS